MGVNLAPIALREESTLEALRDRVLAVDGNAELYQFLALIRQPDGTPLRDSRGNVTSHLVGLLYRSTRLVSEHGARLLFVFDGKPPRLKREVLAGRRRLRERYEREYREARARGDLAEAYSKAVMTSRLTPSMTEDAKRLLALLGIPFVQAPGEGEAQAAHMASRGDAWAVGSKDFDSLLFGAPRLVRFVTFTGRERLPSKGISRPLVPEIIHAGRMLDKLGISREQLVDLAILMGTDFNPGIRGIGPKTALNLLKKHGRLEDLPAEVGRKVTERYEEIRDVFLRPEVTDDYGISFEEPDEEGVYRFLCEERDFSRQRVKTAVQRLKAPPRKR
jgi:flap endonuclease-1